MDNDLPPPTQKTLKRNAHIQYFLRCLRALPTQAQDNDSNRITIAFFCLSGLDLLGALVDKTTDEQRKGWAEWIWSLQAHGGFRGSTFMGDTEQSPGHLPSTYTALMCLAILRAPLDRLDIPALSRFIASCQAPDGSFSPLPSQHMEEGGFQNDVRMTYCASVVCSVTRQHGASLDIDKAASYIQRCRTWEGGYSSRPGVIEAQGGTSYCSVASLSLLPHSLGATDEEETVRWLIQRQIGGFQGRPGKLEDVCYSFWIGGALSILGKGDLVSSEENRSFLLSAQSPLGGFAKEPGEYPDPFHAYLALAALAMSPSTASELDLKMLDVKWNVSDETAKWLRNEMDRIQPRA